MAELPILPLKTDALLADTQHMSAEEFGAYCRLLFTMWRHGARLSVTETEMIRIAGVSKTRWKKIENQVLRPMTIVGDVLTQKRLSATWMDVQERRGLARTAATKRWKGKR